MNSRSSHPSSSSSKRNTITNSPIISDSDTDSLSAMKREVEQPILFTFTAIQIVNHFLEVFAMPQSTKRILAIGELFSESAKMLSLKNPNKVYLDGAEKISNSFLLAEPTNATLSKRVFFDTAAVTTAAAADFIALRQKPEPEQAITFCLDFHRAGMSPGLGDLSKPTVLLYRCNTKHITSVWGMVDKEGLAESLEDLTMNKMRETAAWKLAIAHVLVDVPDLVSDLKEEDEGRIKEERRIHFHNYDNIDVWG